MTSSDQKTRDLLKDIFIADPEIAEEVASRISTEDIPALAACLKIFVEDTIWGLSLETFFGRSVALGYVGLVQSGGCGVPAALYHRKIREFGKIGTELAKLMAEHMVPVLALDPGDLFKKFLSTADVMLKKGAYTLYGPFKVLDDLCGRKDRVSAEAYLDLLSDTFSLELTYKQCRPFTYTLPKAVSGFSPEKRAFQIYQLDRIIKMDIRLADKFLDGMAGGLYLLEEQALDEFVTRGLARSEKNIRQSASFLSLESKAGRDVFSALQVTAPLSQVSRTIRQYVNARTGFPVDVKPLSLLPENLTHEDESRAWVVSDGRSIYLPDEISRFDRKQQNLDLYKLLAKLEAGLIEFGTYDFDIEKIPWDRLIPGPEPRSPVDRVSIPGEDLKSDLERFTESFPDKSLASDLLTIFEHGRILASTAVRYPGLFRQSISMLREEHRRDGSEAPADILAVLYRIIVLDLEVAEEPRISGEVWDAARKITALYRKMMTPGATAETSAALALRTYGMILGLEVKPGPLKTPFGRKIHPELHSFSLDRTDRMAITLKKRLEEKGIRVYRSDVKKKLLENNGCLTRDHVRDLALSFDENARTAKFEMLSPELLSAVLKASGAGSTPVPEAPGPAFFYKEWDTGLGDYLHHHTRVCERTLPESSDGFYENALRRRRGLVKQIRYAFELLKPEGLSILRQWVEGDEFDYRALLDFAMDKKAGLIPSDRLYIKRIKQERDVSVLLLVDLSRSTANAVPDGSVSVLDVEKESIVLFCEALEVVGDAYAIAGFSGTGRMGVDYFIIKGFDETLGDKIRNRISAMSPQRSTRMGAAIRHAAAGLEKAPSKVKLLIIIGDGFPNDVDYKKEYALEDVRKAVSEARSKNIHAHAITVNMAGDPKLDRLYGNVHHNVISDVKELPDKLLRIYGALTRH